MTSPHCPSNVLNILTEKKQNRFQTRRRQNQKMVVNLRPPLGEATTCLRGSVRQPNSARRALEAAGGEPHELNVCCPTLGASGRTAPELRGLCRQPAAMPKDDFDSQFATALATRLPTRLAERCCLRLPKPGDTSDENIKAASRRILVRGVGGSCTFKVCLLSSASTSRR